MARSRVINNTERLDTNQGNQGSHTNQTNQTNQTSQAAANPYAASDKFLLENKKAMIMEVVEAGGDWQAVVDELRRKNENFPRLAKPRWRIENEHRLTFAKLVQLFGARVLREEHEVTIFPLAFSILTVC